MHVNGDQTYMKKVGERMPRMRTVMCNSETGAQSSSAVDSDMQQANSGHSD